MAVGAWAERVPVLDHLRRQLPVLRAGGCSGVRVAGDGGRESMLERALVGVGVGAPVFAGSAGPAVLPGVGERRTTFNCRQVELGFCGQFELSFLTSAPYVDCGGAEFDACGGCRWRCVLFVAGVPLAKVAALISASASRPGHDTAGSEMTAASDAHSPAPAR